MRASILSVALALAALGCGPQFKPSSELKTLRVLGVQKVTRTDTKSGKTVTYGPYAKPGETVNMSMLWHDASKKAPRPVQVAWASGCFDPPGDLYYGCFQQLSNFHVDAGGQGGVPEGGAPEGGADAGAGEGGTQPPPANLGAGSTFSFTIPSTVPGTGASIFKASADPSQPPYGLAYVFFAVCAGQLSLSQSVQEGQFPIECHDPDSGALLGPDDFVAGYSSIYIYKDDKYLDSETNPLFEPKFGFNGKSDVPADCTGDACLVTSCVGPVCTEPDPLPVPKPIDCSTGDARCVKHCDDDGASSCPSISIKPVMDAADQSIEQNELDLVAQAQGKLKEQAWVRYFATRGSLKSEVRLLQDAQKGFSTDYGTVYYAPKKPGPVTIWAVAQDNRGGATWSRLSVQVQ